MVPTKERNHSAILLSYKAEKILVDCGEGTQRQLKKADVSLHSLTMLLISHWDGDHVLGIPGLLQSLSASDYQKTLKVFGPAGTKSKLQKLMSLFNLGNKLSIEITEIRSGVFYRSDDFCLEAQSLQHTQPTLGYAFIEQDRRKVSVSKMKQLGLRQGPLIGKIVKGKSIQHNGKTIKPDDISHVVQGKRVCVIMDTMHSLGFNKIAKEADLLICESTYLHELVERAKRYKHMTARQAAELAKHSKVKQLILTHFSARYKKEDILEKEAKQYFKQSRAASDLMRIKL